MKRLWRIRLISVVICISTVFYLGFFRGKFSGWLGKGYSEYKLSINEVMVNNRCSIRDEEGDFEGWIEIYNRGNKAINLNGFGLSNESRQPFLWTFPDITIEPEDFLIVWTSAKNMIGSHGGIHTSFKLKNKDKVIVLTSPDNCWNDIFVLKPMGEDISYGRLPDGGPMCFGFDEGTPGKANSVEILIEGPDAERSEGPLFSHKGGFYTRAINLALSSNHPDAKIYYTLDGSAPTKESSYYTKPIFIPSKNNEAAIVRARIYREGYPASRVITQSYFINENIYETYNTPVVSLVTDPANLFDYKKGIYVAGRIFDQWVINNPGGVINQATPANYNQRGKKWEREGSIELFEADGSVGLVQNVGIRTHGGYSRANALKPLSLYARKEYDDKEYFYYNFFDEKAVKRSRLLLRTSATDSKYALFRDAFIQSLVKGTALDLQNSRPCIVYINGKYYGIHNIREAYDKTYISERYNMDPESVVIVKNPTGTAGVEIQEGYAGDEMHYNKVIKYIKEHNMKAAGCYDYVRTLIDTDNYIEYAVLQIYCDNRDWPGNNVFVWRKRTAAFLPDAAYGHDGRWRWLVYDLDYGFGLHYGKDAVQNNTLKMATEKNGPPWPNPPWSTLLLRSLLEKEEFRNQFINTFADRLNTIFLPETVIEKIEAMKKIYYPNIMTHITRWGLHGNKIENWLAEIEGMKSFASERPKYMYQYIAEYFGLKGTDEITIEMSEGGSVKVNTISINHGDAPWKGTYFSGIPITIEAVPEPGFTFEGWEGAEESKERIIKISLMKSSKLKAYFKELNKSDID